MKKLGKLLCWIGLHNWVQGLSGKSLSPLAYKCKRCDLVRIFHGWGYTYGKWKNNFHDKKHI